MVYDTSRVQQVQISQIMFTFLPFGSEHFGAKCSCCATTSCGRWLPESVCLSFDVSLSRPLHLWHTCLPWKTTTTTTKMRPRSSILRISRSFFFTFLRPADLAQTQFTGLMDWCFFSDVVFQVSERLNFAPEMVLKKANNCIHSLRSRLYGHKNQEPSQAHDWSVKFLFKNHKTNIFGSGTRSSEPDQSCGSWQVNHISYLDILSGPIDQKQTGQFMFPSPPTDRLCLNWIMRFKARIHPSTRKNNNNNSKTGFECLGVEFLEKKWGLIETLALLTLRALDSPCFKWGQGQMSSWVWIGWKVGPWLTIQTLSFIYIADTWQNLGLQVYFSFHIPFFSFFAL